jgi:hypothetical protein
MPITTARSQSRRDRTGPAYEARASRWGCGDLSAIIQVLLPTPPGDYDFVTGVAGGLAAAET